MEATDRLPDENILHLTALEEVFGGFSHEIAQPLHTIMIASQVLQLKLARSELPQTEKDFLIQRLNIVTSQVQRATDIVEGLRAFSRGSLSQQRQTDGKQILRRIQSLMGQQFLGRGIELVFQADEILPPPKQKPQLLEDIIIQGMAFAREAVTALDAWHRENKIGYKKSVAVTMSGDNALTVGISWIPGERSAWETVPDPAPRPGMIAAASILNSAGGSIDADRTGVLIHFP